jgi:hypothetical protein
MEQSCTGYSLYIISSIGVSEAVSKNAENTYKNTPLVVRATVSLARRSITILDFDRRPLADGTAWNPVRVWKYLLIP